MLTSLELKVVGENEQVRFSPHFGSLLHGALMQQIDPDYATYLHENALKPYCQFLYFDRNVNSYVWKINTLNEEAHKQIITPLLDEKFREVYIEQKKTRVKITDKKVSEGKSYRRIAEEYYVDQQVQRKAVITFLTPTSFKINGEFVIFPYITNIYGSLLRRWESFHTEISLDDMDVLDHLVDHTKMVGYNLRSTKFGMEKVAIPSFTGEVCFHIAGPLSLVRIAQLLFAFGEYAGVGAKTALGMGGIKVG